jgi:hypothetical protein
VAHPREEIRFRAVGVFRLAPRQLQRGRAFLDLFF